MSEDCAGGAPELHQGIQIQKISYHRPPPVMQTGHDPYAQAHTQGVR
ncbi:MAG: hypothetical protein RBU37_03650 [Myxococcota bacterium]|nr:hypothetical protein [Myxococcota bacterium]